MPPNPRNERFAFYLDHLENWKVKFPYLETYRMELPGVNQGIPNFALPISQAPESLLSTCIDWLERYIINNSDFSEEQKANYVYSVFDYLDVTLLRSGVKQLFINNNPAFFVNPYRYWKVNSSPGPLSSSTRSFETFGRCHWDNHYQHLILSELVQDKGDPLRKLKTLKIGLFPLSEQWNIQWKYTKVLNPTRKTHGFIASDTSHNNREQELSALVDIIRGNEVHIACFPELMLREQDTQDLWNRLLENYIRPLQLPFFLLVGGSFHVPKGDHFVNKMPLLLYCFGKTFPSSYCKLEPFTAPFDKLIPRDSHGSFDFADFADWEYFYRSAESRTILKEFGSEDIEHDPGITILETETFGKFGFAICKDVLPDQSKILRQYGKMIDHLVVISLNMSDKADFSTIAGQLARKRSIATLYVNAKRYDPENVTPTFYIDFQSVKGKDDILLQKINPEENCIIANLEQKGLPSKRTL